MRTIFTLLLVSINFSIATAQWSNTTNLFTDSLVMPVSIATGTQNHAMSITSYPDSGTIVFWEDYRNNNQVDVFAQKYDKTGHALWAADGIPVATGPNPRHFYSSMNGDYRNYSYAATDSAGGMYISYLDDSAGGAAWQRVTVQHLRANGSAVFPGVGCIIAAPEPGGLNYSRQQLVADGNKGFFIAYMNIGSAQDVFAWCYRDEGGTMRSYGGGQMDRNAYLQQIGQCSDYTLLMRDAYASDFYLYPDLQHGCVVLMTLAENAGGSERTFIGLNKLLRIKKTSTVFTGDPSLGTLSFAKDSVMIAYNIFFHTFIFQCGNEVGTSFVMDGNGYLQVSGLALNQYYPKGLILPTGGNINVDLVAADQRRYIDSSSRSTNYATIAYYDKDEIYDSIPYAYTVFPFQPSSFESVFSPAMNKLNVGQDTILSSGSYADYEFSLASTGNEVFATAASLPLGVFSTHNILLQQLQVTRQTADSFAIGVSTGVQAGVVIGKELSTGFGGTDIQYENPLVVAGSPGNALFYINEVGRAPRVSPIVNKTELAWGAMGRPILSGRDIHGYYYPTGPFVTLDPLNGSGLITWDDDRGSALGQAENIYMLHLDSLNLVAYSPPIKGVKLIYTGSNIANPATLLGASNAWTTIDMLSSNATGASTVLQILDNYNLGAVQTQVYENTGTIRATGGVPYLDRNITILPEHNPAGAANISLRLFFTNEEFAALQAADPSILDPGFLSVVKQPNTTGTAPDTYVPGTGEVVITPNSWRAVSGGYYLEITVNSFSNFFIQKGSAPLPVTWLGVQAKWFDPTTATVTWQVADQQQVKDYTVQHSVDGGPYTDVPAITASALTAYSCNAPANPDGTNAYRVVQRDLDGKKNYSIVVILQSVVSTSLAAWPNPARDLLTVAGLNRVTEVGLLNAGGSLIGHLTLTPANNSFHVGRLPAGLYFLLLTTGQGTQTLKFMKE